MIHPMRAVPTNSLFLLMSATPTQVLASQIPCGETVEGQFVTGGETFAYSFHGQAGEQVVITSSARSGFDTCWRLLDPDAVQVGANVCEGSEPRKLPKAGLYTIVVYESGQDGPGPFAVSLEFVSQMADGIPNGPPDPTCKGDGDGTRIIQCGVPESGAFDVVGDTDTYTFEANNLPAVSIGISARPLFDAYWQLYDPLGNPVQGPVSEATATRTLPIPTGTYTIVVYESSNDATGPYTLSMNFVGQSCCAGSPGFCDPEEPNFPCGGTGEGQFVTGGETFAYSFHGQAGEQVVITSSARSGFDTCWRLLDPDAVQVGANVCEGSEPRKLPKAGLYTIVVYESGQDGPGPFAVSLEFVSQMADGIPNGPPDPTCKGDGDGTRIIQCGVPESGAFDVVGDTDTYTFEANNLPAVSIGISARPLFDAYWQLYDPLGNPVQGPVSEATATRTLPIPTGTYTIVVYESSNDATGPYTLSMNFVGRECPCGNGMLEGLAGEECDEGPSNGSATSCCATNCLFRAAGDTCRPEAGLCDAAETCSGAAGTCPADAYLPPTTVCRSAAGECDLAENCSGSAAACSTDAKKSSGTACASDSSACTLDQCDGTAATCQHPAGNAGTVCRASAGVCDPAETCTGSSTTCPGDVKSPTNMVCRTSAGVCDIAETCDGTNAGCPPADVFAASGVVCRAAAGECDLAESCPGTGPNCPADAKKTSGATCTGDGNACTLDRCNGISAACQHTAGNAGTECRAARDECDFAEHCDGQATTCPADLTQPDNTACNDDQFCTDPDRCQSGTCTGPARPCDDAKSCTADRCDEPTDQCVSTPIPAACDDHNACTADACGSAPAPSGCAHTPVVGTPCDDAHACTQGELCQADGTCGGGQTRQCEANACQVGSCREDAGGCVTTPANENGSCDDGNACTQDDHCRTGICQGTALGCDDQNPCTADGCAGSGGCTHTAAPDGTACDNATGSSGDLCRVGICADVDPTCGGGEGSVCNDDNECTDGDVCRTGVCAGQEECRVALPCAIGLPGVCRIEVLCTGACRVVITVVIQARPRSRCRIKLFESPDGARAANGAGEAKDPRRISKVAKGTIDANGELSRNVPLNKLGLKLLEMAGGDLLTRAEIRITEPGRRKVRKVRLLHQAVRIAKRG